MTDFDRAKLQAFLTQSEGESPPVFVGREDILRDIETAACLAWSEKGAHGRAKATRVIQGAPGAGKTSILAGIAERCARQTGQGSRIQFLYLESGDINTPGDILEPLAKLVNPSRAPEFLARYQQARTVEGGIGLAGIQTGGAPTSTLTHADPHPSLKLFDDWASALDPGTGITAPIIIAIDEYQRFKHDETDPVAKLLQVVHGKSGLPLTLVLAGLGDTADRAEAMGLTRGKTVHPVQPLEREDVSKLMTDFCRNFGLDPAGHETALAALAAPCMGWPRHLHFALQAFAVGAIAADGDLVQLDWAAAGRIASHARTDYYHSQRPPAMHDAIHLVAAVLRDVGRGCNRAEVHDHIDRHAGSLPGKGWRIPDNMDASGFMTHLIHQGALQEEEHGLVTPGIPSFRRHLISPPSSLQPIWHDILLARDDRDKRRRMIDSLSTRLRDHQDAIAVGERKRNMIRYQLRETSILAFGTRSRLRRELAVVEATILKRREALDAAVDPAGWPPLPLALRDLANTRTPEEHKREVLLNAANRGALINPDPPLPGPVIVVMNPAHMPDPDTAASIRATVFRWDADIPTDRSALRALAELAGALVPATGTVRQALDRLDGIRIADEQQTTSALAASGMSNIIDPPPPPPEPTISTPVPADDDPDDPFRIPSPFDL